MQKALNKSNFLIKDSTIGYNRILIFTTIVNLNQIRQSLYQIINGTFKTVPTIFKQLYTIYRSIGEKENSQIMPLIYVLMSSKSEKCYGRLFEDLIDYSKEQNIDLSCY